MDDRNWMISIGRSQMEEERGRRMGRDGTGRDGTGCIQNKNPHFEEWWESICFCGGGGFFTRPVFPETTLITAPFDPIVLKKVIFVDGDWFIFYFFSFLCALFMHPFLSLSFIIPQ